MTLADIEYINQLIADAPKVYDRLKEDGARVRAFAQDWKNAMLKAKTAQEKGALVDIGILLFLKLAEGGKAFRWYDFRTHDVTKKMRLLAYDIAETLNFETYKNEISN